MSTYIGQVSASADDAHETTLGIITLTGSYPYLADSGQWLIFRFDPVTIPQGWIIDSATLDIYITTLHDDIFVDIYGEDIDDSVQPTAAAFNISSRVRTAAKVDWDSAGIGSGWQTSPDITAIIQEIVNRGGWASGYALSDIFDAQASVDLAVWAYDVSSTACAILTVDYHAPAATTTTTVTTTTIAPTTTTVTTTTVTTTVTTTIAPTTTTTTVGPTTTTGTTTSHTTTTVTTTTTLPPVVPLWSGGITTPSAFQSTGLSIAYSDSLFKNPRAGFIGRLSAEVNAYEHEKLAFGGWGAVRLELAGNLVDVNDWTERGMGRHIEVYNPYMVLIWEGFVNSVSAMAGPLSTVVGPLLDIGNRASVTYAPILDATTDSPIVGSRTSTIIAENATSQARYGIIEKVLSGGTCLDADAELYRDTYLAENAFPLPTETINIGAGGATSVSLDCVGYKELLNAYVYQDATTGTTTISAKLQNVLAADPNNIFSIDYSQVETNAYLTTRQETDNAFAVNIIRALISLGDIYDNRYTFGIYANRRAAYRNATTRRTRYQHRITGKALRIETWPLGGNVDLWDVEAGEWLYIPDYTTGKAPSENRRLDPRYIFLETIRFSFPDTLMINGMKLQSLPQLLAKQGLGGY